MEKQRAPGTGGRSDGICVLVDKARQDLVVYVPAFPSILSLLAWTQQSTSGQRRKDINLRHRRAKVGGQQPCDDCGKPEQSVFIGNKPILLRPQWLLKYPVAVEKVTAMI